MGELEIVRRIRDLAAGGFHHSAVVKGIGDDCAVLRPSADSDLVFTTDFVLEGSHFTSQTHKPQDVGHKALARSLSDLAAMGSEPVFCLVSLAIRSELSSRWVSSFYKGLLALANRFKITVAGGDLSKSDKVIVDVMCCGQVPKNTAVLRSGARAGHRIYVSGRLGAAAHSGWRLRAEPRIEAGRKVRRFASAGMDLSDGRSLVLQRLCTESNVSAEIQSTALPIAPGATLDEALHGGEDYELLFTAPATAKVPKRVGQLPLTCIGLITRLNAARVRLDGRKLQPRGYDHFR